MIRGRAGHDTYSGTMCPRSRRRLWVGLFTLAVAFGQLALNTVGGNSASGVGLLSMVLGFALGGALVGGYVSDRFRTGRFQSVLLPSLEILIAYSLFGALVAALYGGFVIGTVVTGLLLVCSLVALLVTASRIGEPFVEPANDGLSRLLGHTTECSDCGEPVELARAVPGEDGHPCHQQCEAASGESGASAG